MNIGIGADSYGFELKEAIKKHLEDKGFEVDDKGVTSSHDKTPYYDIASEVAQKVSSQEFERGVLICGTGMGMAIIANKFPHVYAAVCENTYAAQKSRSINNSNILTMGGFITTLEMGKEIVNVWLATEFTQGWEPPIKEWLHNSMKDIQKLESQQFSHPPNDTDSS